MADRMCHRARQVGRLVDRFGKCTVSRVALLLFYDFIDSVESGLSLPLE